MVSLFSILISVRLKIPAAKIAYAPWGADGPQLPPAEAAHIQARASPCRTTGEGRAGFSMHKSNI